MSTSRGSTATIRVIRVCCGSSNGSLQYYASVITVSYFRYTGSLVSLHITVYLGRVTGTRVLSALLVS